MHQWMLVCLARCGCAPPEASCLPKPYRHRSVRTLDVVKFNGKSSDLGFRNLDPDAYSSEFDKSDVMDEYRLTCVLQNSGAISRMLTIVNKSLMWTTVSQSCWLTPLDSWPNCGWLLRGLDSGNTGAVCRQEEKLWKRIWHQHHPGYFPVDNLHRCHLIHGLWAFGPFLTRLSWRYLFAIIFMHAATLCES